jgi:transposase
LTCQDLRFSLPNRVGGGYHNGAVAVAEVGGWLVYLRAMQGHKQFVDKVVLRFRLSERVPKQNLYRRLAELLDWDFLYQQTQSLYSHTGQPSLDPVVFFKLMLVSRLENLVSDRRLIEHCSLRLDILYFLGYEVDEDLP